MKRGTIVTIALQGYFGKPRPALIIQSDLFAELSSVTVLPCCDFRRASVDPRQKPLCALFSDRLVDHAGRLIRALYDFTSSSNWLVVALGKGFATCASVALPPMC